MLDERTRLFALGMNRVVIAHVFRSPCAARFATASCVLQQQSASCIWIDRPSFKMLLFSANVLSHTPFPMLARRSLMPWNCWPYRISCCVAAVAPSFFPPNPFVPNRKRKRIMITKRRRHFPPAAAGPRTLCRPWPESVLVGQTLSKASARPAGRRMHRPVQGERRSR